MKVHFSCSNSARRRTYLEELESEFLLLVEEVFC